MSINRLSNKQHSLVCFIGTSKPHCNIYCNSPTVFKHTDLPPAFGPEIIKMRFLSFSSIFKGTIVLLFFFKLASKIGWRASNQEKPLFFLNIGFPAPIRRAYFAFALIKSILARNAYAESKIGMNGLRKTVNSVNILMISLFSSNSASFNRLFNSTTSAGSI